MVLYVGWSRYTRIVVKFILDHIKVTVKVKVIPQQVQQAEGVPGRLRPRIFLTFDTTRVVGRQP